MHPFVTGVVVVVVILGLTLWLGLSYGKYNGELDPTKWSDTPNNQQPPVQQPAQVDPIPSGLKPASYTQLGCYRDNVPRVLPTNIYFNSPGGVFDYNTCYQGAKQKGFKYFGRQFNQECWGGNNPYDSSGKATNCNYMGGDGAMANEVYQINY